MSSLWHDESQVKFTADNFTSLYVLWFRVHAGYDRLVNRVEEECRILQDGANDREHSCQLCYFRVASCLDIRRMMMMIFGVYDLNLLWLKKNSCCQVIIESQLSDTACTKWVFSTTSGNTPFSHHSCLLSLHISLCVLVSVPPTFNGLTFKSSFASFLHALFVAVLIITVLHKQIMADMMHSPRSLTYLSCREAQRDQDMCFLPLEAPPKELCTLGFKYGCISAVKPVYATGQTHTQANTLIFCCPYTSTESFSV